MSKRVPFGPHIACLLSELSLSQNSHASDNLFPSPPLMFTNSAAVKETSQRPPSLQVHYRLPSCLPIRTR
jgi:hypothetical protein